MKPLNKLFIELTKEYEKENNVFNPYIWLTAWKVCNENQNNKNVI